MGSKIVIICDGSFPRTEYPRYLIRTADFIICCDGSLKKFIRNSKAIFGTERLPDRVIGDMDSLPESLRKKHSDIIVKIDEQEHNDQTKAFRWAMENLVDIESITILGATGQREDHTIGNISLLMEYMRMGAEVRSYTDYGIFIPCKDTCTFECRKGQQVSIFNFTAKGLKEKGLAYPIYDFTSWWQGTLNKCTDTSFTIEAEGEYLVFLNY